MKYIKIKIVISQETDEYSHKLFGIFDTHSFDETTYPKQYEKFLENIVNLSIKLVRGKPE